MTESPDPHIACRRVLDAALYEWEERMAADNVTVLVAEFDWGGHGGGHGGGGHGSGHGHGSHGGSGDFDRSFSGD